MKQQVSFGKVPPFYSRKTFVYLLKWSKFGYTLYMINRYLYKKNN